MNDKSQIEIHTKVPNSGIDLECTINSTEEGHQASCPICPWTSGTTVFKGSAKIRYYRHLDYIWTGQEK